MAKLEDYLSPEIAEMLRDQGSSTSSTMTPEQKILSNTLVHETPNISRILKANDYPPPPVYNDPIFEKGEANKLAKAKQLPFELPEKPTVEGINASQPKVATNSTFELGDMTKAQDAADKAQEAADIAKKNEAILAEKNAIPNKVISNTTAAETPNITTKLLANEGKLDPIKASEYPNLSKYVNTGEYLEHVDNETKAALDAINKESTAAGRFSKIVELAKNNPTLAKALGIGQKVLSSKAVRIGGGAASVLGTGLEGYDAYKNYQKGDMPEAIASALKAAGSATMLKQPALGAAMIASGVTGPGLKRGALEGSQLRYGNPDASTEEDLLNKKIAQEEQNRKLNASNSPPITDQELKNLSGPNSSQLPPNDINTLIAGIPSKPETKSDKDESENEDEDQQSPEQLARSMVGLGDQSSLKALQAALQASQGQQSSFMDRLKAAQQAQSGAQLLANMNQAFSTVGRGIAGLGGKTGMAPDQTSQFTQNLLKQAEQPVDQFKMQTEMQKYDPTSSASVAARSAILPFAKKLGIDTSGFENASAADLGNLEKIIATAASHKEMNDRIAAYREETRKKQDENMAKMENNRLNNVFSRGGDKGVQQAKANLLRAKNAEQLLADVGGDPNNLDPVRLRLLVIENLAAVTGGRPTKEEEEQMLAGRGIPTRIQEAFAKITGHPKPTNAGDFAKIFTDYFQGVKYAANKTIYEFNKKQIETRKKTLGDFYDIQKEQNLDPYKQQMDEYEAESEIRRLKNNPDVIKYAKDHFNGDLDYTIKYLKDKGQIK